MDFIAAGNVMLDSVRFADGSESDREHIGGPATFAYSGIRLWTDSVMQCSNLGADYHTLFDPWVEKNKIETKGFKVKCDRCNHSYLVYNPDGTYSGDPLKLKHRTDWEQDMGYMKTSPQEIGEFTKEGGVKGVYLAQNCEGVFWTQLGEIKKRDGFKMMWEMESPSSYLKFMDEVKYAMQFVDIFSINIQEAETLFDVKGDEACIKGLQELDVDMTIFRVGERGLYMVTPDEAIYLPPAPGPVVDPTGCGNTSTGAALYAYAMGYDALMVGIMSNVASAQNIRQFGVIPDFDAVREESYTQAKELYNHYHKE
jgi:hypothetical protein